MPNETHNNPPSAAELALEPFNDILGEAENWTDGAKVETAEQMKAVDVLIKGTRKAKTTLEAARKEAVKPLNDAVKTENAIWKAIQDPVEATLKSLVELVGAFKAKLAAQQAEAERAAREAAAAAKAIADAKAKEALGSGDSELHQEAMNAEREAKAQQKAATKASSAQVKGLRTVTKFEVEDYGALVRHIAQNDKEAMTAFAFGYARQHHKTAALPGVKVWQDKEAY